MSTKESMKKSHLFDVLLFRLVVIQDVQKLLIDFRLALKSILEQRGLLSAIMKECKGAKRGKGGDVSF